MINGVSVIPLKQISDDRGCIKHMLRSGDSHFQQFGEIYFSTVHPDVVKGWHIHKAMTLNYAVVYGEIKLVLYDDRENSSTKGEIMEIVLSEKNYNLVIVPPMVWNGFACVGQQTAIVANCATMAHDPDEIMRLDPFKNDIPYDWGVSHGG